MGFKLELLGWEARGLRCPDHEVDLTTGKSAAPHCVTLLQMPNGTGKTTTLRMLRATLSGSAQEWTPSDILDIKGPRRDVERGEFVVTLLYGDRKLTMELTLDYKRRSAHYRTSHASGVKNGYHPPRGLTRFFARGFVELFVFDGELAQDLLSPRKTRARDAVDALFQLNLLSEVSTVIEDYWNQRASKVSATQKKGLARRKKKYETLSTRLGEIEAEREGLVPKLNRLRAHHGELKAAYSRTMGADKDLGDQIKAAQRASDNADRTVERIARELVAEMRNPQALSAVFAGELQDLKSNLDHLKLPASTCREFFEELARAEQCVCGRALDDQSRQYIRDRADTYLAEDAVGALNSLKTDITTFCSDTPESYHEALTSNIAGLSQAVRERGVAETRFKALEEQRLAKGEVGLAEKKKELETLQAEIDATTARLAEIDAAPDGSKDEKTSSVKALRQLVKDARKKYEEASDTVLLSRKTEALKRILDTTVEKARERLCEVLVSETNTRLAGLLTKEPVSIREIQQCLRLEGRSAASMGQTLSTAYAFLSTLFGRGQNELPFVVDSPAGALDLGVRSEVAQLLPSLFGQFISFITSGERDRFVKPLCAAAQGEVQFITLFRKTAGTEKLLAEAKRHQAKESETGVLVPGRTFFELFDVEEEGD